MKKRTWALLLLLAFAAPLTTTMVAQSSATSNTNSSEQSSDVVIQNGKVRPPVGNKSTLLQGIIFEHSVYEHDGFSHSHIFLISNNRDEEDPTKRMSSTVWFWGKEAILDRFVGCNVDLEYVLILTDENGEKLEGCKPYRSGEKPCEIAVLKSIHPHAPDSPPPPAQ